MSVLTKLKLNNKSVKMKKIKRKAKLYGDENFPLPVVEELRRLGYTIQASVWRVGRTFLMSPYLGRALFKFYKIMESKALALGMSKARSVIGSIVGVIAKSSQSIHNRSYSHVSNSMEYLVYFSRISLSWSCFRCSRRWMCGYNAIKLRINSFSFNRILALYAYIFWCRKKT